MAPHLALSIAVEEGKNKHGVAILLLSENPPITTQDLFTLTRNTMANVEVFAFLDTTVQGRKTEEGLSGYGKLEKESQNIGSSSFGVFLITQFIIQFH